MEIPSFSYDPLWYPNSEATHYITNDTSSFSKKTSYHGNDVVKLGNSSGMKIININSAHYTLPHTDIVIKFNQLVHVPNIIKSLLSMSKFVKDNDVFFEFHTNHCLVKSQATKQILLQGKLRGSIYVFSPLHLHISSSTNNTIVSFVNSAISYGINDLVMLMLLLFVM